MARSGLPVVLLIAIVAVALTGCSRNPAAPTADGAPAGGANPALIGSVDDTPPPVQGQGGPATSLSLGVDQEGVLTNGRFRLVIHKNSLKMPATITMFQPDADPMQVDFVITPPEANDFQVPVRLVADCSDDVRDHAAAETVYWWKGQWEEAEAGSVENNAQTITAHAHELLRAKLALRGNGSAQHASN
jgi:hypothetical protein